MSLINTKFLRTQTISRISYRFDQKFSLPVTEHVYTVGDTERRGQTEKLHSRWSQKRREDQGAAYFEEDGKSFCNSFGSRRTRSQDVQYYLEALDHENMKSCLYKLKANRTEVWRLHE